MKIALEQLAEFRDDPSISERDPNSPLSFCCVTEEVRKSQEELYQIYSEGIQSALSPLAPDGRPLRKYVTCPPRCGHRRLANNPLTVIFTGTRNARTSTGWTLVLMDSPMRVRTFVFPRVPSFVVHPACMHACTRPLLVSFSCPSMHTNHSPPALADAKQLTDRLLDPSKDRRRTPRRAPIPLEHESSPLFVPSEPVTQEVQQVARIRRATVLPQSPADKHVIKGSMAKVIASGTGTSLQRRLLR